MDVFGNAQKAAIIMSLASLPLNHVCSNPQNNCSEAITRVSSVVNVLGAVAAPMWVAKGAEICYEGLKDAFKNRREVRPRIRARIGADHRVHFYRPEVPFTQKVKNQVNKIATKIRFLGVAYSGYRLAQPAADLTYRVASEMVGKARTFIGL